MYDNSRYKAIIKNEQRKVQAEFTNCRNGVAPIELQAFNQDINIQLPDTTFDTFDLNSNCCENRRVNDQSLFQENVIRNLRRNTREFRNADRIRRDTEETFTGGTPCPACAAARNRQAMNNSWQFQNKTIRPDGSNEVHKGINNVLEKYGRK